MNELCIRHLQPGDMVDVRLRPGSEETTRLMIAGHWKITDYYGSVLSNKQYPIAKIMPEENMIGKIQYNTKNCLVAETGRYFPTSKCLPIINAFHYGLVRVIKKP